MNVKTDADLTRPAGRLLAVLGMALALAGCSRELSAQSTRAADPPAAVVAAAAQGAETAAMPAPEVTLRALPDFSPLVERYGAAVVNVEVVEKPQRRRSPGPVAQRSLLRLLPALRHPGVPDSRRMVISRQ